MDIIETIKKDKAYVKCKLIVKNWEKDFKIKYSRTPSKFDIKEAPANIKYAYKKYFQLKSAALENSLSVCDFEHEMQSPESPCASKDICEKADSQEQSLPALPSVEELDKLLLPKQSNNMILEPAFSENLSKKLFHNRKFSLRNPRKFSLPKEQTYPPDENIMSNINTIEELKNNAQMNTHSISDNLSFTINETYNNKRSNNKEDNSRNYIQNNMSISNNTSHGDFGSSVDYIKNAPVRQIDTKWLARATGLSNLIEEKTNSIEKFGLGNITVNVIPDKPKDYVENSESEDDNIVINKLKPALKKRKISPVSDVNPVPDRHDSSKDEEITPKLLTSKEGRRKARKPQLNRNVNVKKKLNVVNDDQQKPDITEFLPFGLEENVNPRHAKVTDILKTIKSPIKSAQHIEIAGTESDKLQAKIQSGTMNENFIKINIEKKVFVRGRKGINFSKYKKQLWKDKKALHSGMEFPQGGKIVCFKCNSTGHMARYCTAHRETGLLPLEDCDENSIPTLEDMQNIVNVESKNTKIEEQLSNCIHTSNQVPEYFLKLLSEVPGSSDSDEVKPIFSDLHSNSDELYNALQMFGHDTFRSGQELAIKRILSGMSTLLILATGSGKSLCYQLPAYIYSRHYKCITLVISPLVSLMEDQVLSMPEFLKAGCLHTNQAPTQRRKIIEYVKNGDINILLISPEALIAGDTSNGFAGLFKSLPPIAFACIDEAHCVSQWSHNFRPSYLMICRVLREKLKVKCILGLTATASQATINSIISHINVPDALQGVITNPALPNNLYLSVSLEKDKDRALVSFLNSETICSFNSIIVYCIRRNECERVAAILRSCLSEPGKINMEKVVKKRKRMSYVAEAYHAGMSAAQRKKIQKHFMDGTLRIIVATVAFGMGINKSDIRCIIHYNMPPSFESYVQEVGRAGRDGQVAYCHVFLNNNNTDKNELLKHIHANSIDRPMIRRLLQKVFVPCNCISQSGSLIDKPTVNRCTGHEVGIPIDATVEELDLPSENIATLLCYIELHPKKYIKVLNNAYTMCKITAYGGPSNILEAAKTCPPLAMAYLLESKKDPDVTKRSVLEFNVIEVASAIGWESGMTKYQLKNLEWINKDGMSKKSKLKVEYNTLGFKIKAPGDLDSSELDCILDDLHNTVQVQEKVMLHQLEEINKAFHDQGNYSFQNIVMSEDFLLEKSNRLKLIINDYFKRENNFSANVALQERPLDIDNVVSDVRALFTTYKDCKFTGRSVARIFQGISSPNYPALVWGKCKYWRSHIHEDFYGLIKIATQQLIQIKM